MLLRNTVRYASAFACLYALLPAAIISGVTPGIVAKAVGPSANAAMNDGTELNGSPAAASAGGTVAAIVLVSRFDSITLYTVAAIDEIRKRIEPATPLAVPNAF